MIRKIIISLLLLTLLVSACKKKPSASSQNSNTINTIVRQKAGTFERNPRKPMAWGHQQTIYVFADDDVWQKAEPFLRYSLERDFFTTENEQLFEVKKGDFNNIDQFFRFKNLIFLADMNSTRPVSVHIKNIMNEQALSSVEQRNASMFLNNNLWANDQIVVFFLANSHEHMLHFLKDNTDTYFNLFKQRFIDRVIYQSQKLKGYKDSFFLNMPFKLYIPETYRVFKRDLDNNFISFLWRSRENQETNPDKYISIYWEYAEEDPIDDNWLAEKRKHLAWKYYDEDEFDIDETIRGQREIAGKSGWFLYGRWQNKKYFMGGAFRSYAFYDADLKTAYIIDTSVYFPAGYKLKYLLELEGLADTFISKRKGEL